LKGTSKEGCGTALGKKFIKAISLGNPRIEGGKPLTKEE